MIKVLMNQPKNSDIVNVTELTQDAKNLFKSNNKPYSLKDGIEGPNTIVVFDEHFIMVMRDADSNECMAKMSKLEKYVYWDYINYQSIKFNIGFANPTWTDEQILAKAAIEYRENREYNTPEIVVEALSAYSTGELLELDTNSCYDSVHVWE
jgi:hypothetical protein